MLRGTTIASGCLVATALVVTACLLGGCEFGMGASGPECSVTPEALGFGTVAVGSSSQLSFVVENVGVGTLDGVVYEDSADFSISGGSGQFSLQPGQTHVVTVGFAPTTSGSRSCSVQLGTSRCQSVQCSGVGSGPICDVDPLELDFGTVSVGSYDDRTFTIRNTGDGVLTGNVTESYPHFAVVGGGGSFSLVFGQVHTVTVRFEPTTTGEKEAAVTTGVHCSAVYCTGNADEGPQCEITPEELNFRDVDIGTYDDRYFDITNVGGGTLSGFVQLSCSDYSIQAGAGEFELGAGETHRVTVRFAPTTAGLNECGVHTGTVHCGDVPCSGTGVEP